MTTKNDNKKRCPWVPMSDPLYVEYHDHEWGVHVRDDHTIFEFLLLESAQAGLSWRTVLHKRENYRKAFAGFDPEKISTFTKRDVARLMNDAGIIRNRLKIGAAINNARVFLDTQKEFGTFANYVWQFTGGKPLVHKLKTATDYQEDIPEAVALSQDLKKRGCKFLGSKIIYAHMQATGMVNDHVVSCFRYGEV